MSSEWNASASITTHVDVDSHAITLAPAHGGRDNDQRILCDEVPYASVLLGVVVRVCLEVELESPYGRNEEQDAANVLQECPCERHDFVWLCGDVRLIVNSEGWKLGNEQQGEARISDRVLPKLKVSV